MYYFWNGQLICKPVSYIIYIFRISFLRLISVHILVLFRNISLILIDIDIIKDKFPQCTLWSLSGSNLQFICGIFLYFILFVCSSVIAISFDCCFWGGVDEFYIKVGQVFFLMVTVMELVGRTFYWLSELSLSVDFSICLTFVIVFDFGIVK